MDKIKIIEIFSKSMDKIHKEYMDKVFAIPVWQLDNSLPNEFKYKDDDEKYSYLLEKFKINNPFYLKLKSDLNLLINNGNVTVNDLSSINLDPRYLESIGLKETQIDNYYQFVDEVKALC